MKAVKTWAFILALACLGGQARAAEVQFRAAVAAETAAAFARDDFKAIETRYAAALASGERSPAGAFTAGLIRSGVFDDPQGESAVPGRDDHWLPIERKLDQWAAQFPHSSLVAVLQSAAYIGHGWSWRGGGYARSVTPEGFKKVEEYTQRAYAALQARQKIGRKDPYWYVQMLHVARIQGWRGDRYGQLVQEATSAFPLNQDIYFAIGTSLQPRWGGSLQAIASFAAWAVEQTRQAEGEALYARIYWSVREPEALGGPDVDWGRIRAGFDEVVKRYPDSWNLNNYARMACEARDFATAKRVLLRIGEDVEPSAWLDRPTYIRCRTAAGVQESAATAGPKGNAPVPPPAATGGRSVAPGAAQAEALTSNDQVHTALQAGRYREVEAFYEKLRKDRTRQADGVFLFEKFYYAVYWYSSSDPNDASYWPKIDAATQAWVTHSPKSHLAAMTRAFALTYRGEVLQARGGSWAEVNRFASEARRLVDGSRGAGAGDVLWHATRLRVAGLQGVPRAEVVAMIEAAAQVDPYPMRLWLEASVALSPSGENGEDLVWLMKFAAERTAGQEGTSMQARVLHAAFWRFHQFLASPFGSTSLRWRELHESFQDWKRRYPDGYRLDLHGAMACAARDRKVTANVLAQTGEPSADIWDRIGGKNYAARCRKWASGSAEAPTT